MVDVVEAPDSAKFPGVPYVHDRDLDPQRAWAEPSLPVSLLPLLKNPAADGV